MPLTHEQAKMYGKKGGRPRGRASIESEKARTYIADHISRYMPLIMDSLMTEVKKGNVAAAKELFDRGFGRAPQALDITTKGSKIDNSPEIKELSNKFDNFFKDANK